jgi:hypothetical protein
VSTSILRFHAETDWKADFRKRTSAKFLQERAEFFRPQYFATLHTGGNDSLARAVERHWGNLLDRKLTGSARQAKRLPLSEQSWYFFVPESHGDAKHWHGYLKLSPSEETERLLLKSASRVSRALQHGLQKHLSPKNARATGDYAVRLPHIRLHLVRIRNFEFERTSEYPLKRSNAADCFDEWLERPTYARLSKS